MTAASVVPAIAPAVVPAMAPGGDACLATVVIPVFNSAGTLERAIRSAMAQTVRDIEILVADDGSTDGSAAVADALAAGDGRIRVLRCWPNGGKAKAMNKAAAAARGRWLAVLDADDAYRPGRLEKLIGAAEDAGTDMAADNLEYRDPATDRAVRTGFAPGTRPAVIGTAELVAATSSFAAFDYGVLKPVVRTEALRRQGLAYREGVRLAEDFYYLLDYLVAGGRMRLLDEALYVWTLPFSPSTRRWTATGSGPWRYDYRNALECNGRVLAAMRERGERDVVRMLERRGREYRVMAHYLDAQRLASEGAWLRSALTILRNPTTWRLLAGRVAGRAWRALHGRAA